MSEDGNYFPEAAADDMTIKVSARVMKQVYENVSHNTTF
jgi:hypothetical protein